MFPWIWFEKSLLRIFVIYIHEKKWTIIFFSTMSLASFWNQGYASLITVLVRSVLFFLFWNSFCDIGFISSINVQKISQGNYKLNLVDRNKIIYLIIFLLLPFLTNCIFKGMCQFYVCCQVYWHIVVIVSYFNLISRICSDVLFAFLILVIFGFSLFLFNIIRDFQLS